jgi:hypothetical protein
MPIDMLKEKAVVRFPPIIAPVYHKETSTSSSCQAVSHDDSNTGVSGCCSVLRQRNSGGNDRSQTSLIEINSDEGQDQSRSR